MTMTRSVAAARRLHKTKELVSTLIAGSVLILLCGAFLWGCGQMAVDSWKEHRADVKFRSELAVAGSKSIAHHFLVSHWLQCKPILQTRASCYSSIRGSAAASGDAFVRQIDAAAKELDLI